MITLKTIVESKIAEVDHANSNQSVQLICSAALPTKLDFIASMREKTPSLIAEIKPKSPSEGEIFQKHTFKKFVDIYSQYAQAVSVLCDHQYFGGGYNLVQEVRDETDLPILAKEFIIDPVQIQLARASGADAILLIASILTPDKISRLSGYARDLNMQVLFEIHEESEIEKMPKLHEDHMMIGINNRNLSTMKIDLSTTEKLSKIIRTNYPNHLLISESGISTKEDVTRLEKSVNGFLIGTAFLQSEDALATISDLF